MAAFYCDSASGVTEFAQSTAYSTGARIVPLRTDTGTNHLVAKRYVWECTTAGTTAAANPTWDASYTPDSSTETSGTAVFTCRNPGYSSGSTVNWTFATPFIEYANEAARTAGDVVLFDDGHSQSLIADLTVTVNADVHFISVDKNSSSAPSPGAVIGAQATNYSITLNGAAFRVSVSGVTFRNGTGTGSSKSVIIGPTAGTDGLHIELESCGINIAGSTASRFVTGSSATAANSYQKLINCTLTFGNTAHGLETNNGRTDFIGCTLAGTAPTTLIKSASNGMIATATFEGCDLSGPTTLVGNFVSLGSATFRFVNCRINATTFLETPTTITNKGQTEVFIFNCDDGDEHFRFYHGDAFGETRAVDTVYLSDGASHDGGTTKVSWQIITRASNCSFYTPYVSPWSDKRWTGTAQIAPYFEMLRAGSTTNLTDSQVWAEFSAQATSGSTRASFVNDRLAGSGTGSIVDPTGTDADQAASSKTASDWTGESAEPSPGNCYQKIGGVNITPAEIGYLRGRVIVGEPNITVYVCPKIRT